MKVEVFPDADTVARTAAQFIAAAARDAVAARGRFTLAVSGGHTPWEMLRRLAAEDVPWKGVHLFQVDERVAPAGDKDRNLTHLKESLLGTVKLLPGQVHAMPVEDKDLAAAAARYAKELESIAGSPPVLDLVHLGLGPDGHTASLVPGDKCLEVTSLDVTQSGPYQGHMRLTLTYPVLDRARTILWLITGADKVPMFARLKAGDRTIPAGRVRSDRAVVLADAAAAGPGAGQK
jgi:6-phosphogluconolactonase